jgi:hypothetical protein
MGVSKARLKVRLSDDARSQVADNVREALVEAGRGFTKVAKDGDCFWAATLLQDASDADGRARLAVPGSGEIAAAR